MVARDRLGRCRGLKEDTVAKSARSGAPRAKAAKSLRRMRPDIVTSTMYLPRGVHQALREIAFKEDRKIHDLVVEGLDIVLKGRGYPGFDKLRGKDGVG
jgi:hypothetical protein